MTTSALISRTRGVQGAIRSLLDQIDQMKGMFPDGDNAIADAVESGEEAFDEVGVLLDWLGAPEWVRPTNWQVINLLAAVKAGRDALADAMEVHVYDAAQGEAPGPDCSYAAALKQMDEAIAASGGPIQIVVQISGGLVQDIGATRTLSGLEVITLDYDTDDDGSSFPVDQGDGSRSFAVTGSMTTFEAIAVKLPTAAEEVAYYSDWRPEADGSWFRAPGDGEGQLRVTAASAEEACELDSLDY